MLVRFSVAIAAICLFSNAAFSQVASKPTDPQIAHIAYTAGVIDITAAKQAIPKLKNKDVVAFANDMMRDHWAVNNQALDLVKKLKTAPEHTHWLDTFRLRSDAPRCREKMNRADKTATNRRGQDRRLDFVDCLANYK